MYLTSLLFFSVFSKQKEPEFQLLSMMRETCLISDLQDMINTRCRPITVNRRFCEQSHTWLDHQGDAIDNQTMTSLDQHDRADKPPCNESTNGGPHGAFETRRGVKNNHQYPDIWPLFLLQSSTHGHTLQADGCKFTNLQFELEPGNLVLAVLPMQRRVPVTRSLLLKCIIYILCTDIDCLQESRTGMSLSCSKLLKMQPN
jgi:hypothetical protein